MKRTSMGLAAGMLAVGGGLALAAPAAADYPPTLPSISIAGCSDVRSGVQVKVKDLQGRSTLVVDWSPITAGGSSGEVTTTASGGGNATVKLRIRPAGRYLITATGFDSAGNPWTGDTSVTVRNSCSDSGDTGGIGDEDGNGGTGGTTGGTAAGGGSASGGLADTGADTAMLLTLGAAAIVAGGAAVVISRRRRHGDDAQAA